MQTAVILELGQKFTFSDNALHPHQDGIGVEHTVEGITRYYVTYKAWHENNGVSGSTAKVPCVAERVKTKYFISAIEKGIVVLL